MKGNRISVEKKGKRCLNCGHELLNDENYCPECGQINDERRLSLKIFLHTTLAGFYSFDSRFLRTIIPLIFKPGKVSKEYIEGRRTYYNNPFQLLLQTAIVFFLMIGLINTFKKFSNFGSTENQGNKISSDTIPLFELELEDGFDSYYKKYLDSVGLKDKLASKLNDPEISKNEKDSIFDKLHTIGIRYEFENFNSKKYTVDLNSIDKFNEHYKRTTQSLEKFFETNNIKYEIDGKYNKDIQGILKDTLFTSIRLQNFNNVVNFARKNEKLPIEQALDSLKIEKTKSNIFWYQKALDFNKLLYSREFRHAYLDGIISKTTLSLFLLLPLFTLLLTMIYFTSKYSYAENLVIVFNLQTVFFILLLISILLYNIFSAGIIIAVLNIGYIIYLYRTLRYLYRQGHFLTIFKFLILTLFYGFLAFTGFLMVSFIVFIF
ncbi:MAG: DUF3667 domain-containing protein [Deltaproteobacteria bacterium]